MSPNTELALALLRKGAQSTNAVFRDGQWPAIEHVVSGRGKLLVVQRTGWGKSFVYFIATKLLRAEGMGPTLLISPLLSLMRNQIRAAERMGVKAVTINSSNVDEWKAVQEKLHANEVDILLISPERLDNDYFMSEVVGPIIGQIGLLVIDEAHCISDWGHDFRPHYRLIERIVQNLPSNLRVLATTATANDRVIDDLREVLGPHLEVARGPLHRPSLFLQTIRLPDQAQRLAWLAEYLPVMAGSGIIYTLTVRDAHRVAEWLRSRGLDVKAYSGKSGEERPILEDALLENKIKALVSTTALGMGFDKPDLSFVIHYQTPGSVVGYYQQVGRAGRAIDSAYGILLSGNEEEEITDYFIQSAFPTREEVEEIIDALKRHPTGLSILRLLEAVNISEGRVRKAIQLLSLEIPAPVVKEGSQWTLTASHLSESFWERAERLTAIRRAEQKEMQEYVRLSEGHMEFLIQALDGDSVGVASPNVEALPIDVSDEVVRDAVSFLRRSNLPLEPRKMWPAGGLPQYDLRGKIAGNRRLEPGRILCVWGDAGWGKLVRHGKYRDQRFSDKLVTAVLKMMEDWNPAPPPVWVTCIPSLRHPALVPDFAMRLAAALGIPFHPVSQATKGHPEQKAMANSIQQARNIDGVFAVSEVPHPGQPVLLVDDMVDSRWTLTIAGYLLRSHGAGPVYPVALASTSHNND